LKKIFRVLGTPNANVLHLCLWIGLS
jgi:hypothetical protein